MRNYITKEFMKKHNIVITAVYAMWDHDGYISYERGRKDTMYVYGDGIKLYENSMRRHLLVPESRITAQELLQKLTELQIKTGTTNQNWNYMKIQNDNTHKQILIIRKDLKSRRGKEIAQCAHASLAAILNNGTFEGDTFTFKMDERSKFWLQGRFKKVCVYVNSEQELVDLYNKAKEAGLLCSLIEDEGYTEFNGVKTLTAVAIGPDFNEKIDPICSHLQLY